MLEEKLMIINSTGLHARPAAKFVEKASSYKSDIYIEYKGEEVNAKSILSLMSLGLTQGSTITLRVKGTDQKRAFQDLKTFIKGLTE